MLNNNSSLITPLPKITVQHRAQKVNTKITQMIKKLGKRREMQIIQQRSQGFWMEDEVKLTLDRIKHRAQKIMKTMPAIQNISLLESKDRLKRHKTYDKNIINKKLFEDKHHLPQLMQMIKFREYQSNKLIIQKRRKILHLLILGLNRRNLGRLYQAIDIILLASFYFEKDDEQRVLKSICLSLICKLHKQIKKQNVSKRKKSILTKKRKSLTVLNYISRQNFLENFMIKLRKTKLVGQFSYAESKRQNLNTRKINGKCQVVIPKPQEIFEPELAVLNYDYIAITVDDYTNSFPYEYPKSLSEKIDSTQYKQMICKLNGLLFPESKCYSFSSIIKLFYLPFMLIFILMLGFSVLRTFIVNEIGRLILIITTVVLVLILGIKISVEEAGYTNYIQIKDKMKEYLSQWQQKYQKMHIKFRMGDNVDAVFIAFPSQYPDSSLASSKLTEIQEVDQNYTEVQTQSKGKKQGSSTHAIRRAGSRFDDNGNLMRKKTLSQFAGNESKSFKKINDPDVFSFQEETSLVKNEQHIGAIQNQQKNKDEKISQQYLIKQSRQVLKTFQPSPNSQANNKQSFKEKTNNDKNQWKQDPPKKIINVIGQTQNADKITDKKGTLKKVPSSAQHDVHWKPKEVHKKPSHKHIKIEDPLRILKKSSKRQQQPSLSKLITPQSNVQEK